MSPNASPDAVQRAARPFDHRLMPGTQAAQRRPTRRALTKPWVIASAAVVFLLLPRRYKKSVLKAALPLALGLFNNR